jgi:chromosomal replication initiation ATPase DnaA
VATTQALRRDQKHEPEPQPGRFAAVRSIRRIERNVELCECMIDIAAALYNVSGRDLRHTGRSSHSVARVRQIAMYVAHVVLGLSMNEVGRGFGRDRTTVLYACHLVEDMREDEEFDRIIAMTERIASAALRNRDGA